jgi:hypothetical protein
MLGLTESNDTIGFYTVSQQKLAANQCYMLKADLGESLKSGFPLNFNLATGVRAISTKDDDTNAPRYNLSGQRVGKDYHGVVIVKGKKIIH